MLPTPRFHHLHLNSVDPGAAIDFYTRQFPSTEKGEWAGLPALLSPNNVMILFNKVDKPPAMSPPSAIWHFGWHVPDARGNIERFGSRSEVKLLPLYTDEDGDHVLINSDFYPAPAGGAPGLTRAQIAAAKAGHAKPKGGGGFVYIEGPEGALIEFVGDHPAERFDHVHLWQEDPGAALEWYRTHLNATVRPGVTPPPAGTSRGAERSWPALNKEGMFRDPRAGVLFGDVVLTWYANQWDTPLVPSRGQLQDHIAFGVADLDAWVSKLRDEGVTFLEHEYRLGETRAVMIEGPSREALELVEVR